MNSANDSNSWFGSNYVMQHLPTTNLWAPLPMTIHKFHPRYRLIPEKPVNCDPSDYADFDDSIIIDKGVTLKVLTRSTLAPVGGVAFCNSWSS